MGDVTTLWDLLTKCEDKDVMLIPVRDPNACNWTTMMMTPTGPLDCGAVQSCMSSIINGINLQITTIN